MSIRLVEDPPTRSALLIAKALADEGRTRESLAFMSGSEWKFVARRAKSPQLNDDIKRRVADLLAYAEDQVS